MKKSLKDRIIYAAKEGWNVNLIPNHILKLESKNWFKYMKILGAISVSLIVSDIAYNNFHIIIYIIIFIYNVIYLLYRIYVSIVKFFYFFKVVFSKSFIIKK